jgi:cytochrome c peroxidase
MGVGVFGLCSMGWSEKSSSSPPLGLPAVPIPGDNPQTAAKIELGKQLYFDPRLSLDNSMSCATCHDPELGWSNGEATAKGVKGTRGGRNSPTVLNTAYQTFQFWDGRAPSLEEQAKGPILNPIEMAMPSAEEVEKKINAIAGYRQQFRDVFGADATYDTIAQAIASFERTVLSGDAPFDRYRAGDASALSPSALRGWELFQGKAHCSACHSGPSFTDHAFHNLGISVRSGDVGREKISGMLGDRGAFKTPGLRDIARSAPYMHDGSLATLEEVVEYYNKGGVANEQLDEEVFPLELTAQEKADLVTFLKEGLASDRYPLVAPPELPQ